MYVDICALYVLVGDEISQACILVHAPRFKEAKKHYMLYSVDKIAMEMSK